MSDATTGPSGRATRLVCVNPNPSIDRTLTLERLEIGAVNRVEETVEAAGGKGAIVARSARSLGHRAVCVGPVGGRTGAAIKWLAEREGMDAAWVDVAGESRTNTTIVARGASDDTVGDTVVNEAGPTLAEREWQALGDLVSQLVGDGGAACISGSLPPGVGPGQAEALVAALVARRCATFVDSHGAALGAMGAARPWCIKVNDVEAAEHLGVAIDGPADAEHHVAALAERVAGAAIITLGAGGAVCATPDGLVVRVAAPSVHAVSAVGSGDAFLAGLASALALEGRGLEESLRWAAAAGAANARAGSQGVFTRADVAGLLGEARVTVVDGAGGR